MTYRVFRRALQLKSQATPWWTLSVAVIIGTVSVPKLFTYQKADCASGSSSTPHREYTFEEIEKELKDPIVAQRLPLYRIPKLFTKSDIEEVLQFKEDFKEELGNVRRDPHGFRRVDSSWSTHYLHTSALFQSHKKVLLDKLLQAALDADKEQNWQILNGDLTDVNIRVIELHTVNAGGGLLDRTHCDKGSLVTVDVMLSDDKIHFSGGEFVTLEVIEDDGLDAPEGQQQQQQQKKSERKKEEKKCKEVLIKHPFEQGDVVVFPSHKYHSVNPVTGGLRQVMVVELWRGRARHCPHRCLAHMGECNYSLIQNKVENFVGAAMPEVDPW